MDAVGSYFSQACPLQQHSRVNNPLFKPASSHGAEASDLCAHEHTPLAKSPAECREPPPMSVDAGQAETELDYTLLDLSPAPRSGFLKHEPSRDYQGARRAWVF